MVAVYKQYLMYVLKTYVLQVPNINIINVDLQDWDKTREAVSLIGPIDLLVNNAGVGQLTMFLETSKQDLDM